MDHAPVVLVVMTVAWLAGRWNRCLGPGLRVLGAGRRASARPGGPRAAVRFEVGYAMSLPALRERMHRDLAGHALWDGVSWGMQVVDATRSAVVVRVSATTASPAAARRLEADLREVLAAFVAEHHPESLELRGSVDQVSPSLI
jgi:hypothetical protein